MKDQNVMKWMLVGVLAAGMVTPVSGQRSQSESQGGNQEKKQVQKVEEKEGQKGQQTQKQAVRSDQKASSLLGILVRNSEGESLGEIEDLVVDMESGMIAYAVLGVGGLLGVGERYIMLPPSAFSPDPEGDGLILNASKERLQDAPGFTRGNWPDPKSVSWGAKRSEEAAEEREGKEREDSSRSEIRIRAGETREASEEVRAQGRAAGGASGQGQSREQGEMTMGGQVTHINPETGSIAIKDGERSQAFVVHPQAKIRMAGSEREGRIGDVQMGDRVRIQYKRGTDGIGVIHSVSGAQSGEQGGEKSGGSPAKQQGSPEQKSGN